MLGAFLTKCLFTNGRREAMFTASRSVWQLSARWVAAKSRRSFCGAMWGSLLSHDLFYIILF